MTDILADIDAWMKRAHAAESALRQINTLVHIPTKDTMFRGAERHFQSDFDTIRKITAPFAPADGGGK